MNSKHFQIQIIVRLLLITVGLAFLLFYIFEDRNYIRLFFIVIFILSALIELFYYINRTNRDTKNFLEAILHNDFTLKYSADHKGKSFGKLYDSFNLVNQKFIEVSQREANEYQYLSVLVQQLEIGVLSYDDKERIHLANKALKQLLGKEELITLNSIKTISSTLYDSILQLKSGQSELLKVSIHGKEFQLSIKASIFKLRGIKFTLVSIHDIHTELDNNEMLAWQKLIRVLTHEIMNSVAPITSLSSTLNHIVSQSRTSGQNLTEAQLQSLQEGLDAIQHRSAGLMTFTEAYRSLTRVPLPHVKPVEGLLYFQRIASLFKPTLAQSNIQFHLELPKEAFTLHIDPDLMEQALINLLKNAKEAVEANTGMIRLAVKQPSLLEEKSGGFQVSITDNGGGIPEEIQENIFIPFYTTKSTGSGVGLSLVKQIVQAHKGEIGFTADQNKGTTEFTIKLAGSV